MQMLDALLNLVLQNTVSWTHKKFMTALYALLASSIVLASIWLWLSLGSSQQLEKQILKISSDVRKTSQIIEGFKTLMQQDEQVAALLPENKDSHSLQKHLDPLLKQNNLTPEGSWISAIKTLAIPGLDSFADERVELSLSLSDVTNLVNFFGQIHKMPMIVLREVELIKQDKTLKARVLISTRKKKS